MLRDIERLIKRELPRETIAGFEPDPLARAQPIQKRSGDMQGRRQPQGKSAGSGGSGGSGGGGGARVAPGSRSNAGPAKTFGGGGTAGRPAAPRRSGGRGR